MFSCGKYNLVHDFFRKLQKSSIPNPLTYRGILIYFHIHVNHLLTLCDRYLDMLMLCAVLVNTFWKEGKIDEAVSAVHEMERRGIVGSASLYYDLARCLCAAGRSREALMQVCFVIPVVSFSCFSERVGKEGGVDMLMLISISFSFNITSALTGGLCTIKIVTRPGITTLG